MKLSRVGVDLAKSVFQVQGITVTTDSVKSSMSRAVTFLDR